MSFPGLGHQDWVELDLDNFDFERHVGIVERLESIGATLVDLVGEGYEVEASADGSAVISASGARRFRAEINASGRLILTAILESEGPLS